MISATDTGFKTLQSLAKARRFNNWIYNVLHPWVNEPLLELGSGLGNISSLFMEGHSRVSLSDVNPIYTDYLRLHFQGHASITGVYELDLVHPHFETHYKHLLGQFHTVIAINVIEHIQDDQLAITNALKLLTSGGSFVMLVPALPSLFNELDYQLGHHRRYSLKHIEHCFAGREGVLVKKSFFNFLGAIGWYLTGSLFRYKNIKRWQISAFEYFVPVCRRLESYFKLKIGLSLVAVFRKEEL